MLNDCSIDAIIAIDSYKNIIAWNTMAEKIHGKKKLEVMGKPLTEIIPSMEEDGETLQAIDLAVTGLQSFLPASKKYYHRVHAENHFIPLKDVDGTLAGVMNIVHDVAHRIKAEQQLQKLNEELQKRYRQLKMTSEELASFTFITSNKIKEPIRQVYTGIENLIKAEASRLSNSGRAAFRRMQSSLNRMDLLLNDVLSLAKISILEKSETMVDLNDVVKKVSDDLVKKSEKEIRIITKELCTIPGHEDYLYLLFHHLMDNAIKFNDKQTAVVEIECHETILNSGISDAEYYCVTVNDNGIGFDVADKERIFKMFEKLHDKTYKGTGVGLALAGKIMDAHEGFIKTESVPGEGSCFKCFFPKVVA